ncbi:MAG TPA: hypothetical protein VHT51_13655, partial [Micropepsaceae bacterium]|nr:hypothetical protein [Micropepsaceae bacterium]
MIQKISSLLGPPKLFGARPDHSTGMLPLELFAGAKRRHSAYISGFALAVLHDFTGGNHEEGLALCNIAWIVA